MVTIDLCPAGHRRRMRGMTSHPRPHPVKRVAAIAIVAKAADEHGHRAVLEQVGACFRNRHPDQLREIDGQYTDGRADPLDRHAHPRPPSTAPLSRWHRFRPL